MGVCLTSYGVLHQGLRTAPRHLAPRAAWAWRRGLRGRPRVAAADVVAAPDHEEPRLARVWGAPGSGGLQAGFKKRLWAEVSESNSVGPRAACQLVLTRNKGTRKHKVPTDNLVPRNCSRRGLRNNRFPAIPRGGPPRLMFTRSGVTRKRKIRTGTSTHQAVPYLANESMPRGSLGHIPCIRFPGVPCGVDVHA